MGDEARNLNSFWSRMEEHLEWLEVRNYSKETMRSRRFCVSLFAQWCEGYGLYRPNEISKPILERFQRHLFYRRQKNGRPLSFRTQRVRLLHIKSFFKWLARQNIIFTNPANDMDLPQPERRLPRYVLTPSEMETVLALPDISQPLGLRDRAMIEVFYATGIRRMELVRLKIFDVDTERGTLLVRQGKGRQDRVVPLGERAVAWIEKYQDEARPDLVISPDDGTLFLNRLGSGFVDGSSLTKIMHRYVSRAKLGKRGACHIFRHSMATSMLENGADIRYVQHILGHAKLSTTEIYTHVAMEKLKAVHTRTHPTAQLKRRKAAGEDSTTENPAAEVELQETLEAESAEDDV